MSVQMILQYAKKFLRVLVVYEAEVDLQHCASGEDSFGSLSYVACFETADRTSRLHKVLFQCLSVCFCVEEFFQAPLFEIVFSSEWNLTHQLGLCWSEWFYIIVPSFDQNQIGRASCRDRGKIEQCEQVLCRT